VAINEKDGREADPSERENARSVRTCVGCQKADDAGALVRLVVGPHVAGEGAPVAVDFAGGTHGRGAHVHARRECLARAAKGGLARSFKTGITTTADDLAQQIVAAADRRIAGLLSGAWRARLVAAGADAATGALDAGAPLVVIATDAGSLVERGAFARAVAEGRAIAWKDKAALGKLLGGRDEVAVCAVSNDAIAGEIARARAMAEGVNKGANGAEASGAPADGQGPGRGTACRSREAR
jgi:predicted RNA-binding protein YlxR (DUF448 family)